jgi:hypothetical protein
MHKHTRESIAIRTIMGIVLLSACPALAQFAGFAAAELHFDWAEVDAVTGLPVAAPNGVLDPGEAARVSLSVSFSPGVGTLIPPPYALGPGWYIHSLARASFELHHPAGAWSNSAAAPGWLDAGEPLPGGTGFIMSVSQAHENGDQRNPVVEVWEAIWTPAAYAPGSAHFVSASGGVPSLVWIEITEPFPFSTFGHGALDLSHTQFSIPIVPAPPVLPGVLGGLALVARRRRL